MWREGQHSPDKRLGRGRRLGGRNSRDYRRSGGGRVSDTTTAVANADRSTRRPSLPPPSGCIRARVPPFRGRGSAAAALRAASHRTPLSFPIPPPITPITPHYLVLCSYAVRSGYAYPSTLLWVDLLHNKVGPCQMFRKPRRAGSGHMPEALSSKTLSLYLVAVSPSAACGAYPTHPSIAIDRSFVGYGAGRRCTYTVCFVVHFSINYFRQKQIFGQPALSICAGRGLSRISGSRRGARCDPFRRACILRAVLAHKGRS